MNYVILDLEFNQTYNPVKKGENIINKKCPFEIIQMGAVLLDEDLNITSTFNELIKPEIYLDINPYVSGLTGISIESLSDGKPFKEAYMEFTKFIKTPSVLCVWGMSDIKELFRNIEYHEMDTSLVTKEYINIQSYASKHFNYPKGINIGLSNAVELLNIPKGNNFHDAFNDAFYTAEVFKKLRGNKIKPKTYTLNKNSRIKNSPDNNGKLDTAKLLKQFEKMYNRELTEDEKSMIKLAYIMGNTKQFQVDANNKEK